LARGRRHVMGSEPAKDPFEEIQKSSFSVTSSTEIRWDDRSKKESWSVSVALTLLSFAAVLLLPLLVIAITVLIVLVYLIVPKYLSTRDQVSAQSSWVVRPNPDYTLVEEERSLRNIEGVYYSISGMDLKNATPRLHGNVSSLVRALPSADGFLLTVSMETANPKVVLQGENVTPRMGMYFRTRSSDELKTYMDYRSGLWCTRVSFINLVKDEEDLRFQEAAIKGAIPSKGWKRINPSSLMKKINLLQGGRGRPSYYAVGEELSNWLVQLRSELASEVGTNVPGQFVVDIRKREADLPLGVVINPDTLQKGPVTGLSHDDISKGLLLCGGDWISRKGLISLLTKRLLDEEKRVMILSTHRDAIDLVSLHEASVGLVLGKDLILNPVDAESIPRTEYVPQLLRALESLAGLSLTSAADLEIALGRAVALNNQTVADVRIDPDPHLMSEEAPQSFEQASKISQLGLEALKRLHQGSGARAFYGTQTAPVADIAKLPLSIVSIDLGSIPMGLFAFDLMMMKLAGLQADKDLVIIIDDSDNLRISNKKHAKRSLWTDSLIRNLSKIASIIVSIDQPHMLSTGVKNSLSSCISFRLREEHDIAAVSSRLALSVIGTGFHSKARWSARESSFLRTMKDGIALLVHDEVETAQPVKLDNYPELLSLSSEELTSRTSRFSLTRSLSPDSKSSSILKPVSGSGDDLGIRVLRLLERYEPLTEEAMRRFIQASGSEGDVEGVLIRLKEASLILEGHEGHSGVSYKNYRLTMKGTLALRQTNREVTVEA